MKRPNVTGEGLFFLFLLGVFLFNAPLISIVDLPHQVFGIPLLYVYLFASWGVLLGLGAFIVERGGDEDAETGSSESAGGGDRTP